MNDHSRDLDSMDAHQLREQLILALSREAALIDKMREMIAYSREREFALTRKLRDVIAHYSIVMDAIGTMSRTMQTVVCLWHSDESLTLDAPEQKMKARLH